jgi:hypothetical protein
MGNTNGSARTATAINREKVFFPANEPVILRLDYDDGKVAPGKFGDQIQRTFDAGTKIAWFDPDVDELIARTGAVAGSEIAITRREVRGERGRASNRWEVELVEDECADATPPPTAAELAADARARAAGHASHTRASESSAATQSAAQQPPPPKVEAAAPLGPQHTTNPEGVNRCARTFADALTAARTAADLDAAAGGQVKWKPEDLRAFAITIYIQQGGRSAQ